MFKRAKVLYVFDKTNINLSTYNTTLKEVLNQYNLDVKIYPEYSENARYNLFRNMIPKTLFCITQNTGITDSDYAFLCSPASSINISVSIKPGEDVWYFEDETFDEDDIEDTHMIRFYWTSRISGNINSEYLSHTNSFKGFEVLYKEEINETVNIKTAGNFYESIITRDRYFTDMNEVAIQGDKGNVIRLGNASHENPEGVIDLVAGKNHYLESSGSFENPNEESTMSFTNDASRILISESGYFSENINEVYIDKLTPSNIIKNRYDSNNSNFIFDTSKTSIQAYEEKDNFYEKIRSLNKNENIENFSLIDTIDDSIKPNITMKSSTINLVVKDGFEEELEETEESLESETLLYNGQIRLIKESNTLKNSSQILLNNNNDIVLDGNTIYLGSFNRLLVDKNIIDETTLLSNPKAVIDNLEDDKKNTIKEMCGKGESILLGYESTLSEPLVLGNTLVVLLKDMIELTQLTIDQNKVLNDKVNSLAQEYSTHTHPNSPMPVTVLTPAGVPFPAAPTGTVVPVPTLPSSNIAQHQTFSSSDTVSINNDLTDIQSKLDEIKSNLKYVLSRFAKTT